MNLRRILGSKDRRRFACFASILVLSALSTSAEADPGARAQTESMLSTIEARPEGRALTTAVVGRARHALSRATQARNAGDQRQGSELEALALELAETARDLLRAAEAEKQLNALEQSALDIETRVVRARALVEQAAARRGRAAEQLRAAEAEKAGAPDQRVVPKKPNPGEARPSVPNATKAGAATAPVPGAASKPASRPRTGGPP